MKREPQNKAMQLTKRGPKLGGMSRSAPFFIESRFAADRQC